MPRRAQPTSSEPEQRIVDAAMRLGAERRWPELSLGDIAREAGVTLPVLYRAFPSRHALLHAVHRRIDEAMLDGPGLIGAEPRERLFEILMRRFDALAPFRRVVGEQLGGLRALSPETACLLLPGALQLARSMRWVLEAAEIPAGGIAGIVRVKLLGLAWLSASRVWLRDDGVDLAATMAALDKALKRVEPWLRLPSDFGSAGASNAGAAPNDETGTPAAAI